MSKNRKLIKIALIALCITGLLIIYYFYIYPKDARNLVNLRDGVNEQEAIILIHGYIVKNTNLYESINLGSEAVSDNNDNWMIYYSVKNDIQNNSEYSGPKEFFFLINKKIGDVSSVSRKDIEKN